MTKYAHITSRPDHQVGEKVIGLCGKEFKVKIKWADIPDDHPICRTCVDIALGALSEADRVIESARLLQHLVEIRTDRLGDALNPETPLILDALNKEDVEHKQEQENKQREKEDRRRAKVTCTCTWTSPEVFTEDPNCPIHGGRDHAEIVEDK